MLANQCYIGFALTTAVGLAGMLGAVKYIDFTRHCLRRKEVWILWHVTSSVDFALVVDLLDDVNAGYRRPYATSRRG